MGLARVGEKFKEELYKYNWDKQLKLENIHDEIKSKI